MRIFKGENKGKRSRPNVGVIVLSLLRGQEITKIPVMAQLFFCVRKSKNQVIATALFLAFLTRSTEIRVDLLNFLKIVNL